MNIDSNLIETTNSSNKSNRSSTKTKVDEIQSSSSSIVENKSNNNKRSREVLDNTKIDEEDEEILVDSKKLSKTVNNKIKKIESSSNKNDNIQTKTKAYYPNITFDTDIFSYLDNKDESTTKYKDKFINILQSACKVEEKGLQNYFQNEQNDEKSKYLLNIFTDVLKKITIEADNQISNDIIFGSEDKKSSKSEVDTLKKTLEILTSQSNNLIKYEDDVMNLSTDCDLWMSAPLSSNDNKKKSKNEDKVNANKEIFQNILNNIENQCQKILTATNDISSSMANAKSIQDKFFTAFQKTRMPNNSKDIMKALQKL